MYARKPELAGAGKPITRLPSSAQPQKAEYSLAELLRGCWVRDTRIISKLGRPTFRAKTARPAGANALVLYSRSATNNDGTWERRRRLFPPRGYKNRLYSCLARSSGGSARSSFRIRSRWGPFWYIYR